MPSRALFLGCDWGSTSFRLRLVETGSRRILAEQSAERGVKAFAPLSPADRTLALARFLAERLDAWPDLPAEVPLIVSGMASSNVGWAELPYARTPFSLDGSGCEVRRIDVTGASGRHRAALLVSGVCTEDDIIRGEECALVGAHALLPAVTARPALALLAGTHPKHAWLRDGALVSFRTHLTGELFDTLGGSSLLAASLDRTVANQSPDFPAFCAGVARVREGGLSAALFQVRARDVLHGAGKAANTWFLSGALVGGELERVVTRADRTPLLLIGNPQRRSLYRVALRELGLTAGDAAPLELDLAAAVIAGQEVLLQRHRGRLASPATPAAAAPTTP